jgi:hypothetical protein
MELPERAELEGLIVRQAELWAELGDEFGERPLVLPTAEYFPDRFEKSSAGVARLLRRMQAHAGLDDVPIVPVVEGAEGAAAACSAGSCAPPAADGQARLSLIDEEWTLRLSPAELGHPVALTTLLARSLAAVFLEETRPEKGGVREPFGVTQDLAGVGLGFGALLMEGSYIYSKSCGGPQVSRLTVLGPVELGLATAVFAGRGGHSLKPALRSLSATQKAALTLARDWANANKPIIKAARVEPRGLVAGGFSLRQPSPGFLGLFERRQNADEEFEQALLLEAPSGDGLPRPVTPAARAARPDEQDDDLRSLVESSLAELRGG